MCPPNQLDIYSEFDRNLREAEHRAAHEDGEKATARAAKRTGTLMAVSLSATTSLEDVAAAGGPSMRRWLQVSLSSRKVPPTVLSVLKNMGERVPSFHENNYPSIQACSVPRRKQCHAHSPTSVYILLMSCSS